MRFFTTLCLLCFSLASMSQARMIFDGAIGISFANGSMANPIYLVIDNDSPTALDAGSNGAILSENEGHIVKWFTRDAPTNSTFTVPFISLTGGLPEYVAASVTMQSVGDMDGSIEFSTYYHDDVLANAPTDVTHMNTHPSGGAGGEAFAIDRFWIMDPAGYTTAPDIAVSMLYDEDELDVGMIEGELMLQRFNSSTNRWLDLNLIVPSVATINTTNNSIGPIGISGSNFFRSWTLTSGSSPLPIELLSFKSECKGNSGVELRWTTASEVNNSHFSLERSEDGIIWEVFADQIPGAGNSSTERSYSAMDNNPFRGLTYYRLTQTDFDGTKESFDPIVNDCDGVGFEIITAYEMQSADKVQLVVSAARDEAFDVQLMDMSGKIAVTEPNVKMFEGLNYFTIDKSNIGYGMYIIRLQSQNELLTRKILLN